MNINDGVLIEDRPAAGQNTFVVRNPSGSWPAPGGEHQFSPATDTMACVSYSATHCLESQILFLTGKVVNLSERFLATMSGTTHQGNYQQKVAETIMKYGMVYDQDWPEPTQFTWDEYYSPIPQSVIDKGQEFLKEYDISAKWISPAQVNQALQEAPLQVVVSVAYPNHAQELLNINTVFDTYEPYEKPPLPSYDHFEILLTPKNMSQFKTQNYKGELRIVLGASTPEQWSALCAVYGVDPAAPIEETV
jgi:hypothetical protein